jgi:F-type H+-transporting ATPase subunit b
MEGFAKLGINLPLLVAFLINFIVLFSLLGLFLYRPVTRMLDERAKRIKESMERTEATKLEYERAKLEAEQQVKRAREEAQNIIAQASQAGERLREETMQQARKEAQAILEKTRAELEEERDKMIGDLRREFAHLTILAAEKVLKETIDKEKHRKLIEETLEESSRFLAN